MATLSEVVHHPALKKVMETRHIVAFSPSWMELPYFYSDIGVHGHPIINMEETVRLFIHLSHHETITIRYRVHSKFMMKADIETLKLHIKTRKIS